MNKLFDLRFVIGIFFLLTGLLLLGYSFFSAEAINRWCGVLFSLFGGGMVLLARLRPVDEE